MPEKTKLEDYANMNNTGFAFIDLNEEIGKEYIIGTHEGPNLIHLDENISIEELLTKRDKIIFYNQNTTSLDVLLDMKPKVLINLNDEEKQKVEHVYELFEKLHEKINFCKNIRG